MRSTRSVPDSNERRRIPRLKQLRHSVSSVKRYLFSCKQPKTWQGLRQLQFAARVYLRLHLWFGDSCKDASTSRDACGTCIALLNCFDHAYANVRAHGFNNRNNVVRHLVVAHVFVVSVKKTF